MKKIISFLFLITLCAQAFASKDLAMRFPSGTPMQVAAGIGSSVSGGTAGSVLFVDSSGNIGQFNPGFTFSLTNFVNTYPGMTISNSAVPNIRMISTSSSSGEGPAIFMGDTTNNERWQYFMLADSKAFTFLNRITDGSSSNFGHALYIDTANRVAIGAAASGTGYTSLSLTDQFLVNIRINTFKGIVIKGAPSQSANFLEITNNSSGVLDSFDQNGILSLGLAGTQTGTVKFNGTTSGTVTVNPAATAGTWTMTLPTTGGTSGYFLQTDGSGTTSWASAPSIVGNDRKTGLTAAQALATYTVGASDASYVVSANVNVTTFAVGTFNVQVAYTDETNTAQTLKLNFSSVTGTIGLAIAATGPFEGIPIHIRCKAGTTIIVSSTGTFTSLTYNLEERIVQK